MSLENKILERMQASLQVMSDDQVLRFARNLLAEAWAVPAIRERIVSKLVVVVGDLPEPQKRGRKPKAITEPAQPEPKPVPPKPAQKPAQAAKPQPRNPLDDDDALLAELNNVAGDTTEDDDENLGALL
jgi:outer membrane biosynthesis protein TonB